MLCFKCHKDTKVYDSRMTIDGEAVVRKRECLSCKARFTTEELILRKHRKNAVMKDISTEIEEEIQEDAMYVEYDVFNDMDKKGLLDWKIDNFHPTYNGVSVIKR